MNRNALGQFEARPRLTEIERYCTDPAYRAACDAERIREQARMNAEIDRATLANYNPANFDEEPGWVSAVRARVEAARIAGEVA